MKRKFGPLHTNNPSIDLKDLYIFFEVQRVSNRLIIVKLVVGQRVVSFLSVYAPQSGLSDEFKDLFFDKLHAVTAKIPASDFCSHV